MLPSVSAQKLGARGETSDSGPSAAPLTLVSCIMEEERRQPAMDRDERRQRRCDPWCLRAGIDPNRAACPYDPLAEVNAWQPGVPPPRLGPAGRSRPRG